MATGILIPPIRNPVFLAKEIASLVCLWAGRFELGVGVGWTRTSSRWPACRSGSAAAGRTRSSLGRLRQKGVTILLVE